MVPRSSDIIKGIRRQRGGNWGWLVSREFIINRKCTLLVFMIACAIGDLLFIILMMIVIGSNGDLGAAFLLNR